MKRFYDNTSHNRAAAVLATMSPDMIRGIVDLCVSKGHSIINTIGDESDGPCRPYAIFSKEYIKDDDFAEVLMGMTAIFTAQMKKLKQDNDFYEGVLRDAFYIPASLAADAAKKIETLDIIGGSASAVEKAAWYTQLGRKFQEGIRRSINFVPSVLGVNWENDQTQKYDIDFLYEVKLFGRVINEFQSRANLMSAQAQLSANAGLFNAGSGIYGDVTSDPIDAYELAIHDHLKPEMGSPLPGMIFGGLKKLVDKFKQGHDETSRQIAEKSGIVKSAAPVDGQLREATQRVLSAQPGPVVSSFSDGDRKLALENAISVMQGVANSFGSGDVSNTVRQAYGDDVADALETGDIEGAFGHILDLAASDDTTGDPAYDETLVAHSLGAYGDVWEGSEDAEMGGLFKRARAKAAIRKANRRTRKATKQAGRISRRNVKNTNLVRAKQQAANAELRQQQIDEMDAQGGQEPYVDQYLDQYQQDGANLEAANPEYNMAIPDGSGDNDMMMDLVPGGG